MTDNVIYWLIDPLIGRLIDWLSRMKRPALNPAVVTASDTNQPPPIPTPNPKFVNMPTARFSFVSSTCIQILKVDEIGVSGEKDEDDDGSFVPGKMDDEELEEDESFVSDDDDLIGRRRGRGGRGGSSKGKGRTAVRLLFAFGSVLSPSVLSVCLPACLSLCLFVCLWSSFCANANLFIRRWTDVSLCDIQCAFSIVVECFIVLTVCGRETGSLKRTNSEQPHLSKPKILHLSTIH